MSEKVYKDPEREKKRLATIRARHGADFTKKNAIKAGKLTPTKFNSATASEAAKKRWAQSNRANAQKGKA